MTQEEEHTMDEQIAKLAKAVLDVARPLANDEPALVAAGCGVAAAAALALLDDPDTDWFWAGLQARFDGFRRAVTENGGLQEDDLRRVRSDREALLELISLAKAES